MEGTARASGTAHGLRPTPCRESFFADKQQSLRHLPAIVKVGGTTRWPNGRPCRGAKGGSGLPRVAASPGHGPRQRKPPPRGRLRARPPKAARKAKASVGRSAKRRGGSTGEASRAAAAWWQENGSALAKARQPRRRQGRAPAPSAARPQRRATRDVEDVRPVARTAPGLNRERRTISDDEIVPSPPSSLDLNRSASAARSGRRELLEKYEEHTETSPALTGGDVDADWESAYSVGDEAPGGDNPTPDQDIVDDIGRAVGVEYQDNEELKGERKIAERDKHRWELDPASSDDWEDR